MTQSIIVKLEMRPPTNQPHRRALGMVRIPTIRRIGTPEEGNTASGVVCHKCAAAMPLVNSETLPTTFDATCPKCGQIGAFVKAEVKMLRV
jgi:hypothetical protein